MGGIFKVGSSPVGNDSSWVIVSVGGSLIATKEGINVAFLKSFKRTIINLIEEEKKRFVVVCGGGKVARDYQNAYKAVDSKASSFDLDFIGIEATKLNAQLMRMIFGDMADQDIINDPTENVFTNKNIVIASGWKPGCSTDYDAVLFALNTGARRVINLSSIDGVYDGDPMKVSKVKRFKEISWDEYLKLIPGKWTPGLSSPFDPVASKKAKEKGLEVFITNGSKLENMNSYLESGFFDLGTIIKNGASSVFQRLPLTDKVIEYRLHPSGCVVQALEGIN